MAGDRGGGGHDRADEVRAAVFALAAFEIAIAGAGTALVRRQDIGVHANAHAAAGVSPLETGGAENSAQIPDSVFRPGDSANRKKVSGQILRA